MVGRIKWDGEIDSTARMECKFGAHWLEEGIVRLSSLLCGPCIGLGLFFARLG